LHPLRIRDRDGAATGGVPDVSRELVAPLKQTASGVILLSRACAREAQPKRPVS
jgi:hypothetical protein